jgi:hypothetical protein
VPSSAEQLEDGVDGHGLDAGRRVELLARHARVCARDHPFGPVVAIVERESEDAIALIEERVVHAPAVDAHALQRPGQLAQAEEDLAEESEEVPPQPVRQPHGNVGETVCHL